MTETTTIGTVHTFPAPAERAPPAATHRIRIEFTGSGGEYFRIWIVNLALTLVTLGIYSAWAKVRRLRYFYGNTQFAGSAFEYHGQPLAILKGRLIAVAFVAPYVAVSHFYPGWHLLFLPLLFIALPFIIVRARRFLSRMSTWRGLQFDFAGTYGDAARVYLLGGLLVVLTLGLWYPRWVRDRNRFLISRTRFGSSGFDSTIEARPYYVAYFGAGILVFVAIVLGQVAIAGAPLWTGVAVFYAVLVLGLTLGRSIVDALTLNAAYNGTSIDGHRLVSDLSVSQMMGLYASNLLLVIVTAGLFYPWAAVRVARYRLAHLAVEVDGDLDRFVTDGRRSAPATGEELGDLLDVDLGL